jgi:hypothetical protein
MFGDFPGFQFSFDVFFFAGQKKKPFSSLHSSPTQSTKKKYKHRRRTMLHKQKQHTAASVSWKMWTSILITTIILCMARARAGELGDNGRQLKQTHRKRSLLQSCTFKDGLTPNAESCQCGSVDCAAGEKYCDTSDEKGPGQCSMSSATWYVKKTNGGFCSELTNGQTIRTAAVCAKFYPSASFPAATTGSMYPPGCSYGSGTLYFNSDFQATTACGTMNYDCICFVTPACTATSRGFVPPCSSIDGSQINPTECTCGINTMCTSETGFRCLSHLNYCTTALSISQCSNIDGSSTNSEECLCGTKVCGGGGAFYCYAPADICSISQISICDNKNGGTENSWDCLCGVSKCTAATGRYCYSAQNHCSSSSSLSTCYEGSSISSECKCGDVVCPFDMSGASSPFLYCHSEFSLCSTGSGTIDTCADTYGTSTNSNSVGCKCGTALCAYGMRCYSMYNYCTLKPYVASFPTCLSEDGTEKNNGECVCGVSLCTPALGYCNEGPNLCSASPVPSCSNTVGMNEYSCACGTAVCLSASMYCYSQHDYCTWSPLSTCSSGGASNYMDCICGSTVVSTRCFTGIRVGIGGRLGGWGY